MNEAAKRAAELANAVRPESCVPYTEKQMQEWPGVTRAFVDFIQHVSDVAERSDKAHEKSGLLETEPVRKALRALILPKPKPDPLLEAIKSCIYALDGIEADFADALRAELAQRNARIVFGDEQ